MLRLLLLEEALLLLLLVVVELRVSLDGHRVLLLLLLVLLVHAEGGMLGRREVLVRVVVGHLLGRGQGTRLRLGIV